MLLAYYYHQFQWFNPLTEYVSASHGFSALKNVAKRARAILKSRTAEQIEETAIYIDWAINEYFSEVQKEAILFLQNDSDEYKNVDECFDWERILDDSDTPTHNNRSETQALEGCLGWLGSIESIGDQIFPNAQPSELFAVMALWMVADVLDHVNGRDAKMVTTTGWFTGKKVNIWINAQDKDIRRATEIAISAIEVICYAESISKILKLENDHLIQLETLQASSQQKIDDLQKEFFAQQECKRQQEIQQRKEKSNKLNTARHRESRAANDLVCTEWAKNKNKFSSATKAGIYYSDWLEEQGYKCEPRTATDWIRKYAKQIGVTFR